MDDPYKEPPYYFENPPPDDRCGAIRFNCWWPDCDYRFPDADRTTPVCPECNHVRKMCGNYPSKGRDRCKWHGGAVPRGIANVNYQGRGVSKSLPTRMLEFYHLAKQDPDILVMTDDIAILKARKSDLLLQTGEYPSVKLWQDLAKTWDKWRNAARLAQETNSPRARERTQELFIELENLILRGIKDGQAWQEYYDVQERLRRLTKSEIDRRKQAESIITENQFKTMLGYIVNVIKTRITDPDQQTDVLADIAKLNL